MTATAAPASRGKSAGVLSLLTLGAKHQVVAITHFPQVAAQACQHFLVHKEVSKGRTLSSLQQVAGNERIEELMRMLGGESKEAESMAKSLLNQKCRGYLLLIQLLVLRISSL